MRTDDDRLDAVRPWPVVDWSDLLSAYSPARQATEGHLRTLRRQHVVSEGLQDAVKALGGRFSGKVSLFCELNLDAAVLARRGHSYLAERYRDASSILEKRLAALLTERCVRPAELVRPAEARSADAWQVLMTFADAVARARVDLPPVPDEDVVTGILAAQVGKWVRFTATETLAHYDVPWEMVRAAGLSIGDPAVVCRELLPGGNALLRLRAGLRVHPGGCSAPANEQLHPLEARTRRPVAAADRAALVAALTAEGPMVRRVAG